MSNAKQVQMSAVPVPKPRAISQEKKPVPLPRRMIDKTTHSESKSTHTNTFTKKVRSLSTTSKQITDEISGRVQETKKAVIASTRQSFGKITRRFSSTNEQSDECNKDSSSVDDQCSSSGSDIFGSIRFQSPLTIENDIYENSSLHSDNDSDESVSLPPPSHPPPPLPDESMYDQPTSKAAAVVNNSEVYEAVFPIYPVLNGAGEQNPASGDTRRNTISSQVSTSGSWTFYDPVTLKDTNEAVYNNVVTSCRSSQSSSLSELATFYENHILELHMRNQEGGQPPARPSKSTILEFDPLMNQASAQDMVMLEKLLQSDMYSNADVEMFNCDQWSVSGDSEPDEYLSPPTPPKRFDSLADETACDPNRKSHFFLGEGRSEVQPETKKSLMQQLNYILKKVPESASKIKAGLQKDKHLDRPTLNLRSTVNHKAILFKVNSKSMEDLFGEIHFRWCVLGNGSFVCYAENSCENVKEQFALDSIMSVHLMPDKKYKFETDIFCFEVNVSGRVRGGHVFGCGSLAECKLWMQKIADALTNRFPVHTVSDYQRVGWAYLRESVSGTWAGAWVILSRRCLYYAKDDCPMGSVDLRKARCIQLQSLDTDSPRTTDKGPNLVVDCPNGALYLRMWTARETKVWCASIKREAYRNSNCLEQQQLTKDDVPVIVEKCINFVYAHGSMSEGIYRRSGSLALVSEVLAQFHCNAWAVTLTTDRYSEHDVANVLKRFLRNLNEPLLSVEKSDILCQISNAFKSTSEKVALYKNVLEQFSTVTYSTLRRLLGHLYFIQSQSARNKMSADNLASIWGPTLVHHDGMEEQWSATEANLVVQLIMLYRQLFPVSEEELDRERLMLQVLERCNRAAISQGPAHIRASGDLRVWVHLWDKNGETVNITVGPQKLAADICMELSARMNTPAYELQLEELVLNDCLRRPVHYSERVLEVVLRWGYWDEPDRKDNCLVLTTVTKYRQFDRPGGGALSEELRFADNRSKQFKLCLFKFERAKLCYYKDRLATVKLQEWNIEDILWYFGSEPRKNPQTKWSISFIARGRPPNRTKGCPYFGHTIAGNELTSRISWVSAMIRAEHSNGLLPPLMPH